LGLDTGEDVEDQPRLELGCELSSLCHNDPPSNWTHPQGQREI
jgi:hypothetical protein